MVCKSFFFGDLIPSSHNVLIYSVYRQTLRQSVDRQSQVKHIC